jgi:hypothetical protein
VATSELAPGAGRFVGRSGRVYELDPTEAVREGSLASVRAARALGPASDPGGLAEGSLCAIKLCRRQDASGLAAFELESACFEALGTGSGPRPVPRLYDRTVNSDRPGEPAGMVLEWCAVDLELWWAGKAGQPDAFRTLCAVMAEIARRAGNTRDALGAAGPLEAASPELRPRKLLRGGDGRWVLGAFSRQVGALPIDPNAAATELMTGTENFSSPEQLFGALLVRPAAQDSWALGTVFFAMLKLRAFLRGGVDLPTTGTESHRFRSHRAALVADLFARKSDLFRGRSLDARQFLYPDRLPDQDRTAIAEALGGIFGDPQEALEGHLAREVLRVLDRALCIDPERRYSRAAEMAVEFELLARKHRESAVELRAARSGPADDVSTQILSIDQARTLVDTEPDPHMLGDERPTQVSQSPLVGPGVDELPPPTVPSSLAAPGADIGASSAQARDTVSTPAPAATPPKKASRAPAARVSTPGPAAVARVRPRIPAWAIVALVVLAGVQATELALLGLLWFRVEQIGDRQSVAAALPAETGAPVAPADDVVVVAIPGDDAEAAAIDALTGGTTDVGAEDPDPLAATAGAVPADDATPAAGGESGASPSGSSAGATAKDAAAPATAVRSGSSRADRGSTSASSKASTPAAPVVAAPSGQGIVLLSGAKGYLMGAGGRAEIGQVAAGTWEVYADVDGTGAKSVGSVALSGGQTAEFKCGFGVCKRTR